MFQFAIGVVGSASAKVVFESRLLEYRPLVKLVFEAAVVIVLEIARRELLFALTDV